LIRFAALWFGFSLGLLTWLISAGLLDFGVPKEKLA
jgi:hypothetical protein